MTQTTDQPQIATVTDREHVLVFRIGDRRFGLPVEGIDIVLPAAAVTPLPGAPEAVLGLFNFHGKLQPVLDAPFRLGAGKRPIRESDLFVLLRNMDRPTALRVDGAEGVVKFAAAECSRDGAGVEDSPLIAGVVRRPDGVLLVHDVHSFLSSEEQAALEAALAERIDR